MRKSLLPIIGVLVGMAISVPHVTGAPLLKMRAKIDPGRQFISVQALYTGLSEVPELTLYLNKNFVVSKVLVDGKETGYSFDLEGNSPPYVNIARPLIVPGIKENLEIRYSGYIKETINDVNMITPDLVELAVYSGWYPMNANASSAFPYELELVLPDGYSLLTNGILEGRTPANGNTTYFIRSSPGGTGDIVILASGLLRVEEAEIDGFRIEMYHSEKGEPLIGGTLEFLGNAVKEFMARFGRPKGMSTLRFAYSPRSGWGYSRLPIFIVSEERALNSLMKAFGREDDLQGCIHEIAHFWWAIAGPDNDWINEGCAEYSAFSYMAMACGDDYREHCIRNYLRAIRNAGTRCSIPETPLDSPDRYANWYLKTALLLYVLEVRSGRERMDAFLSGLYERFRDGRNATTREFLSAAESAFSAEDAEFLKKFLAAPGWRGEELMELASEGKFTVAP